MSEKKRKPYKGIYYCVFNKMKRNAAKRKIVFKITIEYIGDLFEEQKGICNLTGQKLTLKKSSIDIEQTASLDRINSMKGYVKGNVQWIAKDINKMKVDFPQDIFIKLCKLVALKHHTTEL